MRKKLYIIKALTKKHLKFLAEKIELVTGLRQNFKNWPSKIEKS